MQGITDYIGQLPQPVQLVLASVGALFLANKALAYVKFLLGVFVLSGNNVCKPHHLSYFEGVTNKNLNSSASMASPAPGQS